MTQQLDLLGMQIDAAAASRIGLPQERAVMRPRLPGVLVDVPRAARLDPETSHAAADRVRESGALGKQQQRVLDAVMRWPGSTSAELAEKIASLEGRHWAEVRAMVARRLPELATIHVERGAVRVCLVTASECITWLPR